MKKFFTLFLALVASLQLFAYDAQIDGIYYNIYNGDNPYAEVTYQDYDSSTAYQGEVVIPSSIVYNGTTYPVTSIGYNAFNNCSSLTSVTIPNSVTSIGYNAFQSCSSLTSVTIPNSVTSIGDYAFNNCSSLTSVTILNSVTSIGIEAFYGCSSLSTIIVDGEKPASLNGNVFSKNSSLRILVDNEQVFRSQWTNYADCIYLNPKWYADKKTEVTITANPSKSALHQALGLDSLQKVINLKINGTINSYDIMMLRNQMPSLRELDLSDASIVANAYEYTDGYCSKDNTLTMQSFTGTGTRIMKLVLPKSLTTIEAGALNEFVYDLTIQEGITAIPAKAFYNCSRMGNVSLPESLETIGNSAFYGTNLLDLTIPANVQFIGSSAFQSAHIKSLTIPANSRLTAIGDHTFSNNRLYSLSILADSITSLGQYAFAYCGMDTVVLPPNLTSLSSYSFEDCNSLRYIVMPNTLTEVPDYAFRSCDNLDDIQFPRNLQRIGKYAFADCTNLRNVDIPGLVTEIGDYAFKDCNVQSVYSYLFDPFTIGQNTFSPYANANATLYIPNVEDTEMKYLYDTQWSQFLNRVRMDKDFEYNDFYAKGDVIIGDNDDPLNGDPNANLEPGSGLIVEEGENGQSLGTVTITGEPGDWASIIAGCNLHVDSLRLIIKVQGKCWNFYGFPFNIPIADIKSEGKYVIYEYDGKTRAEKDTTGWKRLPKEQTHLYPGHGYIFNFSVSGELSITIPAPNFCNLLEKIMLHFYPAVKDNNKSWNYAANPFFAYYSLNDLNFTGPITFWDAQKKTYRSYRPGDDDYYLSPYEGFFLQNETEADCELTFDKTKTKTKKQKEEAQASGAHKPARKAAAETQREIINLTLLSDDFSDDTRIVINPAAQLTYDLGMDAQKFFSTDNVPQLYSFDADQLPCAINERPIDNGVVNLGMKLPTSGLYSIRATRMDKNLFLLDREMNVLHSFNDGDYTFSASAGTIPARFALVEHYDAPTAVEQISDSNIEQTPDGLYIHGTADIQIYSMTGIELYSGTYSGAIDLPTGVYTLVCNGKPAKVVIQ
ncbi:MAG: leucine-rich repeat domain-containing protein [Paludibacteraceae bacterium]|nr:leucine-rich repeat domain-containing protein [Paludibacteraceae bacterium]